MKSTFTIPAEAHSDDRAIEAAFDALPWFSQASDQAILDLAACEWRGDYPADDVAIWTAEDDSENEGLTALFAYLPVVRKVRDVGFECSVESGPALAWLKANRPALAAQVAAIEV